MRCDFCDDAEVKARKILENNYAWAFPSYIPIVPGHVLIVPKRHVATARELAPEEFRDIFVLHTKLQDAMRKVFGAHGFNSAFNEGEKAGQSVPHFHMHLLPRTPGDTGVVGYEPSKFLYRPGSRAISPHDELVEVAAQIRAALVDN